MTRDIAKALIRQAHWNIDNPLREEAKVIDEIFDYFERELLIKFWKDRLDKIQTTPLKKDKDSKFYDDNVSSGYHSVYINKLEVPFVDDIIKVRY